MYQQIDIPFRKVPQLSKRDVAYQSGNDSLTQFVPLKPELSSFDKAIANRKHFEINRDILVNVLLGSYQNLDDNQYSVENIKKLQSPNTYTIITAHQPSLLCGPLYFIYKIASIISLSKKLNQELGNETIVPVFVMGGEDHDFEEISSVHFFNKTFTWATDQTGSTGRMSLDGLDEVLEDVYAKLGDTPSAIDLKSKIERAYKSSKSYGEFIFEFVHSLFFKYGLVIASMDRKEFKEVLLPFIKKDINELDSKNCVVHDQDKIEKAGFKSQAHARDVNIFHIDASGRHRVKKSENNEVNFSINRQEYTKDELLSLLDSSPENISPNVILRPIYQELIFPNLAYIGGGGELAYWMERPSLFKKWSIPFPILIRRDSFWILDKKSNQWLVQEGLQATDMFGRKEQVIGEYARNQSTITFDFSEERKKLTHIFDELSKIAMESDPTIVKTVGAEAAKAQSSVDYIESKLLKAEKNKNKISLNKIERIKDKNFPNNDGLQERVDNFIPYYLKYGPAWIDEIVKHADPLNKNFKLLIEK